MEVGPFKIRPIEQDLYEAFDDRNPTHSLREREVWKTFIWQSNFTYGREPSSFYTDSLWRRILNTDQMVVIQLVVYEKNNEKTTGRDISRENEDEARLSFPTEFT